MRTLLFVLICGLAHASELADEIIRRACERDNENLELRQQYTYRQTDHVIVHGKQGKDRKNETKTKEVVWIDGSSYSRLVEENGKPLPEKKALEEVQKMDKEIARRKAESPDKRRKRLAEEKKELEDERQMRLQIPEAYIFTLMGEETVSGRPCWRIGAVPKPGFKPRGKDAGMLPKLKGTLWIDKADYTFSRLEAETVQPLSFGLFVFRISPGARIVVEQALVNGELWAPVRFAASMSGKALMFMGANLDVEARFHDYRKFAVESTVTVADTQ